MTPRRPRHLPTTAVGDLASESVRLVGDPTVPVTGAVLDSRAVRAGDLYAALPGANVHGASFAGNAVAAGASAVLTDEYGLRLLRGHDDDGDERTGRADHDHGQGSVPVLVTPDPRAVLGDVSARIYDRPSERLESIGITGTNGKTTTAYILDSALRALGRTTGLVGTIETRIADERVPSVRTTPESCDLQGLLAVMVEEGVDSVTMEVSSHALALHRVDGIVYDVACFTNLSQDHLDFHGSMERYFEAKAALFTPARARRGVVCVDDEWGRRLGATAEIEVVTVANATNGTETTHSSATGRSDGEAVADWLIRSTPGEQSFRLEETGGEARVLALRSPLPGHFNLTNTAIAALTLLSLGAAASEVEEAMTAPTTVPGRAESVELGEDAPQVVVDYAHTPDAIASVLAALRPGVSGRLVTVMGAGGDRDPLKREGMGAAAASVADVVVVTDDNPRSEDPAAIRATVLTGARYVRGTHAMTSDEDPGLREIPGRSEAIEEALRTAGPDGCVAVLGKGHETGQQIGDVVHPYDDRVEVVAAWGRIRQHEGAS